MSFIQNLFTSRDNNANASTYVGQQDRIWWDPVTNSFYYSDGSTPGGIAIGGGSGGNGQPGGPTNSVQINNGTGNFAGSSNLVFSNNVLAVGGNVTANYFIGNVSTTGNIVGGNILGNNYLYANGNSIFANIALTGNIDLGNLYIIDETIYGKNTDQDIVLSPAGTAYIDVPRLKVAVGSMIQGQAQVNPIIASVTLNQVLANSSGPGDTLPAGSYGNPQGVTAPWAVYQFTTVPSPVLEVNDVIAGTGVPVPSIIQWVGNTSGTDAANANVVVTTGSYSDLPTPIPGTGNVITITRAITLAGLDIISAANTTINLLPGTAGNVIIGSSMLPLVNNAFDLGSPTARWRSIYFGGNTIYVFDPVLGVDQSISANNGNLVVGGGTGLNVGSFTFFGNTIAIADPAEDIYIGTELATGNVNFNRPIQVFSNVALSLPTFQVDRDGITSINVNSTLPSTEAGLTINGSETGNTYPRNFGGTLVQLVNVPGSATQISGDSFGANVVTGQNSYFSIASRVARGTVDAPSQTQANDVMMRLTSQGFDNANAFRPGIIRYQQVAAENISNTASGTRHNFQATPVGTTTIRNIANIDGTGLRFSSVGTGGPANIGITFQDGSYQNTAYIASSAVNSLTAGVGLVVSAATGNITIDNTGVITAQGTANQIAVNGSYANVIAGNIVLSLPQDIAPTSNVTFNNVTAGNVTVLGNLTYANVDTVDSYRLYLANNSTASGQINGGGIILGNVANGTYWRSILYDQNTDAWSVLGDYGAGNLIAGNVQATVVDITELTVEGNAHFGNAYNGYDFPNATIQVDENINGYAQIVARNINPGGNASTDIVAVNDIGDDSNNYIDMGINSNAYNNTDYAVTRANDGYLYVNGGNLIIGTQTAGKVINLFTGGTNSNGYIRGTVSDTGLSMVGNVTANNLNGNTVSVTTVTAAGNITAANVSATTVTATNVVGTNITGTLQTAAQNNVTSVGTLISLNVTGTVTGGNIATAGNVSATGNVTGGNLVTPGTIVNSGIITTGTISAFGNITSSANVRGANLTTAGQVTATGNITGGNILTNGLITATGNVTGGNLVGQNLTAGRVAIVGSGKEITTDADFTYNSTTNVLTVAGNVSASYFSGNGSQLTSITGANVTGTVANAAYALNANVSTFAGTVTTNAQPNITSVGTLTSVTSNGVVNFVNTSNVALGAVGNVHITGGAANNVLITNGSGNLSFASLSSVIGVGGNQLVYALNAQQTIGSAKNTLLSLFGLTNGVALASNTRYQYEILFNAQCSKAGTLSYALALSGGAVLAQHNYNVISNKTTTIDNYTAGITMMSQNATGAAITTAQTVADTATFTHTIIQGTIDVTTGGNVNFMVSQDQNTPVTWTINAGSYVKLLPLGAIGSNTVDGTWS